MNDSSSTSKLIELKPTSHRKLIDLVDEAGIDVTDWSNFKGGAAKAASNPKYCYDWSFENRDEGVIVLNLWFDNCELFGEVIIQKLNLRIESEELKGVQKRRAIKMDFSLQRASRLKCPVRVIMCDDNRKGKLVEGKSNADKRYLDEASWYVQEYDDEGNCILHRGQLSAPFIDQFIVRELDIIQAEKQQSTTYTYPRSKAVREQVLLRAKGHCEYCGEQGFTTSSGSLYLESHHIIPLCESGIDHPSNVIALCPNHHREAHFGDSSVVLREAFTEKLRQCKHG